MEKPDGDGSGAVLMRFYIADKEREIALAHAVGQAAMNAGYDFETASTSLYRHPDPAVSVACVWGVKKPSRRFLMDHGKANIKTLFFDKGYTRHPPNKQNRLRVSANWIQPSYLMKWSMPADRFRDCGFKFQKQKPWDSDAPILIAGSSQKFHSWHPSVTPTDAMGYYSALARNIKLWTDREIVWRPKPSWTGAEPIDGTRYSTKTEIHVELTKAHAVIVTGSGISFQSLAMGIPTHVLPGFSNVASGIAPRALTGIHQGQGLPDDDTRWRFCCNVCYCEWTLREYADGQWLEILADQLK